MLEVGEEHAHGAKDGRLPRHDDLPHTQLHGHRGRVHRPRAAAHHHGHGLGIQAVIDDHVTDARGHACVDHREGGHRGLLNGYPERLRQMFPDRPLRRLAQERHAAAQKVAGVEIPQQQVHVRAGGQGTPLPVASRSGRRPGAPRAHLKAPPASIRAMLPPPAPSVRMSIIGNAVA